MGVDRVARLRRDDRADVDIERIGPPDAQFAQGAFQHGNGAVGDLFLQAQHAQGRTPLTRTVEGRGDDVAHHLFGQRRGIDDHRILTAGFGDEGDRAARGRQPLCQLALDQSRNLRRAGEHHPHGFGRRHQSRTNRAITRHQLQHIGREPA
jgi:hypothetical protein